MKKNVQPQDRVSRRTMLQSYARGAGLLAVVSMLTACSQVAPGQASAPTTAPAAPTLASGSPTIAATTVRTPVAASTTGQAKQPGQIIISINGNIPDAAQKALTDAYAKVQPGVKTIWELPAAGSNYSTWLGTQLAAGNVRPDVVSGNYFSSFNGYFNFDKARTSTNPYTSHPWDQDLNFDFFVARDSKGQRYMLATRAVHTMWFYNKDLFDKAAAKPPSTWAEMVDTCAKLKAKDITPISASYKLVIPFWMGEYYFDQYHVNWVNDVRAQPGDWDYDPNLDGKFVYNPGNPNIHRTYTFNAQRYWSGVRARKLRYDTPEMTDMVKNMAEVFPRYANADLFVIQDYYPPFLQQQAAMMFDGTWSLASLYQDMKAMSAERLKALKLDPTTKINAFQWGTFENVPMQGPLVKGPVRSSESATGEYVSIIDKNQSQTDLALNFVMFWLSKPGYRPYLQAYIKSGLFSPGGPLEIRGVQDPPEIQKMFEGIKLRGNAAVPLNQFLEYPVGGDGTSHQKDALNMFQDALTGKTPPEEFGKRFQSVLSTKFDDLIKLDHLTTDDIANPARQPGT